MVCFITKITHNFPKLFFADCCVEPLEGRVLASLEALAWKHRASATHSCESRCFVVETQRDTLPSPMCHIYPWAMNKTSSKQDGFGMPAHVIFHLIHVKSLWSQSWVPQISIWDEWTWAQPQPDWIKPAHKANPGPLLGPSWRPRSFLEGLGFQ